VVKAARPFSGSDRAKQPFVQVAGSAKSTDHWWKPPVCSLMQRWVTPTADRQPAVGSGAIMPLWIEIAALIAPTSRRPYRRDG